MRRFLTGAVAALCMTFAAGAEAKTVLTFAGSDPVGSLFDRQNLMFTQEVNAAGKGELEIKFIQGEALGNDAAVIEQLMAGGVQLYGDELGWYANWVKDFAVLTWGFTFNDRAHIRKFLAGDVYPGFREGLLKHKVRVLAAAPIEPRVMFSTKKIEKPDDLNGLKMRVPGIRPFLLLWQKLGTHPTQVPWAETYLALRNKLVEASDGGIASGAAARFQEVTKYLIRTDHLLSIGQISISEPAWQALTDEQKKIVETAAKKAVDWAASEGEKNTQAEIDKLIAAGMTEVKVNAKDFAEKARAGVSEMEESGAWPKGLWQKIRALD